MTTLALVTYDFGHFQIFVAHQHLFQTVMAIIKGNNKQKKLLLQ